MLNHLRSIKAKCAPILAETLCEIGKEPGKGNIVVKRKKKLVVLPRLFGTEEVKTKVLQLGYCGLTTAQQDQRCDLPGCKVIQDKPWILFEGCSHSFHNGCLDDCSICPLCQKFLAAKAESLATTAKDAILNPKTTNNDVADENNNDDDDNTSNILTENDQQHTPSVDSQVQSAVESISALPIPKAPPLPCVSSHGPQPPQPSPPKRAPKCKNCGHPRKGHTNPKNGPPKCPACPEGVCVQSYNQNQQPAQPDNQVNALLTSTFFGQITEWSLPINISQATIFGVPIGSNACCIIAAIGAMKFFNGILPIPSSISIMQSIAKFADSMLEGNLLYNTLNLPLGQPNLTPQEALQTRQDHYGLRIVEDTGVFSPSWFRTKLVDICLSADDRSAIVTVPPDKSMLMCFDIQLRKIALFESHPHGHNRGGLIAVCSYEHVDSLVLYMEFMCGHDWGSRLDGANITVLAKNV